MPTEPPASLRFRFAPSPNGRLHLGHAYSALVTWRLAEALGGEVLLRIEDIDTTRTRDEFVRGIFEDLAWLGLAWPEPVRRQSAHFDDYRAAAEKLRAMGVLYPCTASRTEIREAAEREGWARDPDGAPAVPGRGRILTPDAEAERLAAGRPCALRLDMRAALALLARRKREALTYCRLSAAGDLETVAAHPEGWGDAVVVRKDTPTSYHLSVVVDDAIQAITHVTRGMDLEPATDLHRLLQELLGLPAPIYHHHSLITDEAGRKLAKSTGDTSLKDLRDSGITAQDIRSWLLSDY